MKTQIELARQGIISSQMETIAKDEGLEPGFICKKVAAGEIVIPSNPGRKTQKTVGIGTGLRTKVNASIGTSSDIYDIDLEVRKARVIQEEKADTIMELSAGGNLDKVRRAVISGNAPYYVLGPLPCDIGAGYDHITAAIGAANSARYGADLICYITPAEHLALPNVEDVREGVRVTRLAVHIGDVAKYPDRREREKQVSLARRDMRWEDHMRLLMFPDKAKEIRASRVPENEKTCTMCGDFCAMERGFSLFENNIKGDKMSVCGLAN